MIEVTLEPELEARLTSVAEQSHATASFIAHEAIARFVEDREDYLAGLNALSRKQYTISQEEMEQRSSVAD